MLHWIKSVYRNELEDQINYEIMNRVPEKVLQEYVLDCFRSIESVLTEIHLVSYQFINDTEQVDQSSYERTRSNKQKDKDQKFMYINDSNPGELIMNFTVDFHFEDVNGVVTDKTLYYSKKMLIPLPDEDGYYYMKGNRYILQLQLTESSTYTTSSALVGKTLLPVKIRRNKTDEKDIDGKIYELNFYEVLIFNKYENFLYFYFATMGFSNTLEYMEVGKYIDAVVEIPEDYVPEQSDYVYFRINNGLFIRVKKVTLINDYIQSIIGSILKVLNNRTKFDDLENKKFWICRIGAFKQNVAKTSHYELGRRHIILFNRMLDEGTKSSVRLRNHNKKNVYAFIRWLIQNYSDLWRKDNLDIANKRLRGNEYVASLLNEMISERIKKFVNTTANTIEKMETKYNNFFSWRGNEIISKLHSSGLMRYDDTVNDLDFFEHFKVTQKGPNSIGSKNDGRTVSAQRRALHPSHVGRLDLNVCSASDPGQSNYISPFCKTDGLYFEGAEPEPETFSIDLVRELEPNDDNDPVPTITIMDPVLFNDILDTLDECSIKRIVSEETYERELLSMENYNEEDDINGTGVDDTV